MDGMMTDVESDYSSVLVDENGTPIEVEGPVSMLVTDEEMDEEMKSVSAEASRELQNSHVPSLHDALVPLTLPPRVSVYHQPRSNKLQPNPRVSHQYRLGSKFQHKGISKPCIRQDGSC